MNKVVVHGQLCDIEGKAKVVETARVQVETNKSEHNDESAECKNNYAADVGYSAKFEIQSRTESKIGDKSHARAHE